MDANIEKMNDSLMTERLQFLILIVISIVVLGFTTILYLNDKEMFQRFIGRINPIISFLIVSVLGIVLFSFLLSQKWFVIYKSGNLPGMLYFIGLAALLGIVMIAVDTKIVFPADMNILFPHSLLFYPAIGFLVEILFHVLPLAVLLFILHGIFRNVNIEYLVWISIFIVALLEPIYHSTNMFYSSRYSLWAVIYVGVHVFIINFVQLLLFRKYDFISMYSFRLAYYLFWHIGWGYLRLKILF